MAFPFFSFGGKKKKEKLGKLPKLPPPPRPPGFLKPMLAKPKPFFRLSKPKPVKAKAFKQLPRLPKLKPIKPAPKKIPAPKLKLIKIKKPRMLPAPKIKIKKIIKFKTIKVKAVSKKDAYTIKLRLNKIEKDLHGLGNSIKAQVDRKLASIASSTNEHKEHINKQVSELNKSHESHKKNITADIEEHKKELDSKLEKSRKDLDNFTEKSRQEINSSTKKSEKEISGMKATVGDVEKAFSGSGFKEWTGVLDDALDEARKLEEKDSKIISVVNKLDRRLANVENHAATVMSAEQRCQMINDNLTREAGQLKQTASNLMSQASALNGKLVQLINAINSSNAQIGQLGSRVSNAEGQLAMLAELKNELSRAEAESAQLSSKLNELERETTKTIVID